MFPGTGGNNSFSSTAALSTNELQSGSNLIKIWQLTRIILYPKWCITGALSKSTQEV